MKKILLFVSLVLTGCSTPQPAVESSWDAVPWDSPFSVWVKSAVDGKYVFVEVTPDGVPNAEWRNELYWESVRQGVQ